MRPFLRKTHLMTRLFFTHHSFSNSTLIIPQASRSFQIPLFNIPHVSSPSLSRICFVLLFVFAAFFSLLNCVVNYIVRVFFGRIQALGFVGFPRSLVLKLCRIWRPFRICRRGKQLRSMRFLWALSDSASINWWLVLLLFASFLEILLMGVSKCFDSLLGSKIGLIRHSTIQKVNLFKYFGFRSWLDWV